MLKITFNKPAVTAWLDFQNEAPVRGLQIRLMAGGIAMRPVSATRGKDIITLDHRERGGAEVEFEGGRLLQDVVEAFKNPFNNPFFTLKLIQGWIVPEPYHDPHNDGRKAEPPRTMPALRVWSGELHRSMAPFMRDHETKQVLDWAKIDAAADLIKTHELHKSPGRPPVELVEARNLMMGFERAARRNLPIYAQFTALRDQIDRTIGGLDLVDDSMPAPTLSFITKTSEAPIRSQASRVASPQAMTSKIAPIKATASKAPPTVGVSPTRPATASAKPGRSQMQLPMTGSYLDEDEYIEPPKVASRRQKQH